MSRFCEVLVSGGDEMPEWIGDNFYAVEIETVVQRPMNYTQVYGRILLLGSERQDNTPFHLFADHDSCWRDGFDGAIKAGAQKIDAWLEQRYKKLTGRDDFTPLKLSVHFGLNGYSPIQEVEVEVTDHGEMSDKRASERYYDVKEGVRQNAT